MEPIRKNLTSVKHFIDVADEPGHGSLGGTDYEAFLREAARDGATVVLDAPDEAALAAAAGVTRALVRVTLGVDADTHEAIRTGHHGSKFGLPTGQARELIRDALERGIDVLGLHVHVGSQLADFDARSR